MKLGSILKVLGAGKVYVSLPPCCLFSGGGHVVVDLLFYVPAIICGHSVGMHYFMSFLVLHSS